MANARIDQQIKLMEKHSAALDYEQAAQVRDRIETLRRVTEKQFVTDFSGDIDIIACELEQDFSCIQLFMIRNGTSLGNKPFFNRVKLDTDAAKLIETFIIQTGGDTQNEFADPEIMNQFKYDKNWTLYP